MVPFYALGIGLVKAAAGGGPSAGEGVHRTNRTLAIPGVRQYASVATLNTFNPFIRSLTDVHTKVCLGYRA